MFNKSSLMSFSKCCGSSPLLSWKAPGLDLVRAAISHQWENEMLQIHRRILVCTPRRKADQGVEGNAPTRRSYHQQRKPRSRVYLPSIELQSGVAVEDGIDVVARLSELQLEGQLVYTEDRRVAVSLLLFGSSDPAAHSLQTTCLSAASRQLLEDLQRIQKLPFEELSRLLRAVLSIHLGEVSYKEFKSPPIALGHFRTIARLLKQLSAAADLEVVKSRAEEKIGIDTKGSEVCGDETSCNDVAILCLAALNVYLCEFREASFVKKDSFKHLPEGLLDVVKDFTNISASSSEMACTTPVQLEAVLDFAMYRLQRDGHDCTPSWRQDLLECISVLIGIQITACSHGATMSSMQFGATLDALNGALADGVIDPASPEAGTIVRALHNLHTKNDANGAFNENPRGLANVTRKLVRSLSTIAGTPGLWQASLRMSTHNLVHPPHTLEWDMETAAGTDTLNYNTVKPYMVNPFYAMLRAPELHSDTMRPMLGLQHHCRLRSMLGPDVALSHDVLAAAMRTVMLKPDKAVMDGAHSVSRWQDALEWNNTVVETGDMQSLGSLRPVVVQCLAARNKHQDAVRVAGTELEALRCISRDSTASGWSTALYIATSSFRRGDFIKELAPLVAKVLCNAQYRHGLEVETVLAGAKRQYSNAPKWTYKEVLIAVEERWLPPQETAQM